MTCKLIYQINIHEVYYVGNVLLDIINKYGYSALCGGTVSLVFEDDSSLIQGGFIYSTFNGYGVSYIEINGRQRIYYITRLNFNSTTTKLTHFANIDTLNRNWVECLSDEHFTLDEFVFIDGYTEN